MRRMWIVLSLLSVLIVTSVYGWDINPAGSSRFFRVGQNGDANIYGYYSAEKASDPGFDTGTPWTTTSGWTISGGVATHSGSGTTTLTQDTGSMVTAPVVGETYICMFTISGRTTGSVTMGVGEQGQVFSTNATQTFYLTATSASGAITFTPASSFDGSIDNVSIKKVNGGSLTVEKGLTLSTGQFIFSHSLNPISLSAPEGRFGLLISRSNIVNLALYTGLHINSTGYVGWTSSSTADILPDTYLYRNSANFLELRNSTSNQNFGIDETWTDSSNYSRLKISATSSGYDFTANQLGTGITARPFRFINTMQQATENETACIIQGTTNKATSGNDTVLKVVQVDTASPGMSYLQEWYAGSIGTSQKASIDNSGQLIIQNNFYMRGGNLYGSSASSTDLTLKSTDSSNPTSKINLQPVTYTNTSGTIIAVNVNPICNQASGSSGNTWFRINVTETAVGTGTQRLFSAGTGGGSYTELHGIDNKGKSFWGTVGDSSDSPGNATLNTVSGKSAIAASASACTIANSNVTTSSLIFITPLDNDATAITYKAVSASGSFTVTTNTTATATWKFQWWVIN